MHSPSNPMGTSAPETHALITPTERIALWLTRASIAGLAISVALHVVFLFVAAFAMVGGGAGAGGGPGGPVELAIVTQTELAALSDAPMSTLTPGVEETAELHGPALPSVEMPGGDALPDAGDLGAMGSGMGGAGTGAGLGIGAGSGGAGGSGGTSFFGVEARGSRFAYVVDVSGSMRGEKLVMLKRELRESIEALPENGQFIVVFFESEAVPLLKRERWTDATPKNKKEALAAIEQIDARGGTNPMPAFLISMQKVNPKPDAIYFMTDGLFEDSVADRVIAMNRGGARKIPIHCLSLVDRSSEPLMRRICEDSGGTYHHIENPR